MITPLAAQPTALSEAVLRESVWPSTFRKHEAKRGRNRPSKRRVRCSQLVAELPKQIFPPRDVILALDPLRGKPVDYAE